MIGNNDNTKIWLQYWRNSLTDSEIVSSVPDEKQIQTLVAGKRTTDSWLCEREIFTVGQLDKTTLQKLQKLSAKTKDNDLEEAKNDLIPIIIAPHIYVSHRKHTQTFLIEQQTLTPLWVFALVDQKGWLKTPGRDESSPYWVRRDYQRPNNDRVDYCSIEKSDEWLTKNVPDSLGKNWSGYIEAVEKYYTEIGSPENLMREHDFAKLSEKCVVMACIESFGMIKNILQAYASLINYKDDYPLLLERFCRPQTTNRDAWWKRVDMTESNIHLGHMSNKFGLSSSQRQAIYPALSLDEGGILAINGPPGTGKTTLIQDVLATLMIKSALNNSEPQIIVVASSGNQAVTNVIDSFSGVHSFNRWLPKPIVGLGLYLTNTQAKQREATKKGYLCSNSSFEGFPKHIQNDDFVKEAESTFLESASRYFCKKLKDTQSVIDDIHKSMISLQSLLGKSEVYIRQWIQEQETISLYGGENSVKETIADLMSKSKLLIDQTKEYNEVKRAWLIHLNEEPIWMSLLVWLPAIRRKRENRDRLFVNEFRRYIGTGIPTVLSSTQRQDYISREFDSQIEKFEKSITGVNTELDKYQALLQPYSNARLKLLGWLKKIYSINANVTEFDVDTLKTWADDKSHEKLQSIVDLTLRHKLFEFAVHYWEGRWIVDTKKILVNPPSNGMFSYSFPEKKREAWQRLSMLTPCFVVTLHSAPKFFSAYDDDRRYVPHVGVVDWLVLDESGQIRPDIAAPAMSIGKRALVVGDVKQLEPIYGISTGIDQANAKRYAIASNNNEFVDIMDQGMAASNGSVMRLAQTASTIGMDGYEPGVFLAHHRRCYDPIIQYCNDLSYRGRIIPLRGRNESLFPHMGYAHIKGRCELLGKSRVNLAEAETIIQWLVKVKSRVEDAYGVDGKKAKLGLHIGIITPFKPQGELIKRLLKKKIVAQGDELSSWGYSNFKIGTVNALQGAERNIVLFSPVYTTEDQRFYMLDNMPNRLNVAVSRAKDSFLVFGDMEIFDPALPKFNPRGLLARHLKKALEDVPCVPVFPTSAQSSHEVCTSIDLHRAWLKQAFSDAKRGLLIVSPFLSQKALDDDCIVDLIKQTLTRGVNVKVIVDGWSTRVPPGSRATAEKALKTLEDAGANVLRARNIHTKLICVDVSYMIEGSFNWLSAERTNEKFIRHDMSMRYRGAQADKLIRMLAREIQDRVIPKEESVVL